MADEAAPPPAHTEAPPAIRAQLLATEHWSLLASRGSTQSEVLTRISMFLTLVSAALVSLALVGQATRFSDAFVVFAIAVLGVVCLVGVLTQLRVANVALEDLMYVAASSMVFIMAVNSAMIGLLAAAIVGIVSGPTPVVVAIGTLLGVAYLAISLALGARDYFGVWRKYAPVNPSDSG